MPGQGGGRHRVRGAMAMAMAKYDAPYDAGHLEY